MWQRTELPTFRAGDLDIWVDHYDYKEELDWEAARRQEIVKQTGKDPWNKNKIVYGVDPNPDYYSIPLEEFREQELDRCDPWGEGYWFYNNGKPIHLTGSHYFYLNWWVMPTGNYPEFRHTDKLIYYHWQYCLEDPISTGQSEAGPRGGGKTARAAARAYLITIFKKYATSGIQSKTEDDSYKNVWKKHVLRAYKELPDFLVPINNHGTSPENGMSFTLPADRSAAGQNKKKVGEKPLESFFDYRNSTVLAYDGENITGVLILDEDGKLEKYDCYKRHEQTYRCVYRDGKVWGKKISTTTVQEMQKGGKNFQKVWKASNPLKRNELGMTATGMYKIFIPAYLIEFSDQYGMPVPDEPKPYQLDYLLRRYGEQARHGAKYKQQMIRDQKEMLDDGGVAHLQEVLMTPWTESDLFKGQAEDCPYDLTILRQREKEVNDPDFNKVRVGDFAWKDGIVGSKAVFHDNPLNGRWHVAYLFPDPKDANKVATDSSPRQKLWKPNNPDFRGGFDPTREGADPKKRRSSAAGTIFRSFVTWDPDLSETWVADFQWTPRDPEEAWDEFVIGCFYYGCPFLPESNLGMPKKRFKEMGLYDFLLWRPRTTFTVKGNTQAQEGIHANAATNEYQLRRKKSHIVHHGHKMILPRTVNDTIGFNPAERTQHDLEVASQLSLIATEKPIEETKNAVEVSNFFPTYRNSGSASKRN